MQDSQWTLQEQIFQKTEGSPKFPIEVFIWRISPYLKKLWNRVTYWMTHQIGVTKKTQNPELYFTAER